MTDTFPFAPRADEETVETGTAFSPKFDADGLIVAIADRRRGPATS